MRFTTKFKLECVKKYQNGERIDLPAGWKYQTFRNRVRMWSRIYESLGEIGLEHKKPKRTWQDKMNMIQRVLNGESFSELHILMASKKVFFLNGTKFIKNLAYLV